MKLHSMAFVVAVSMLLVSGIQAFGQNQDPGYANEGPLLLSARAGGQFSDNRDGLKSKTSNLDMFIEPRADYRFRDGERTVLNLALLPLLKWHSNPRDISEGAAQNDTELFGTAALNLMHQLNRRLQFNVADAITYNDDPEISNGGGNVRRSDNHIWNNAHAGVEAGVTETVFAGATADYMLKRYSDSIVAGEEDEDIVSGQAYLKYVMGSGYNLLGMLNASDFKNKTTADHQRGSRVFGGGAGIEKTFSPDMTGKIVMGYQHGEYDDSSLEDIDAPSGAAELTMRAASATRFRVGGSYGLYAPYVKPYSIQTLTAINGAVDHDVLPGRLTATLRGQYGRGHYKSEGVDNPGGDDDMFAAGLSATYRINRTWSCDIGYTHENWDSDVRESFDRNLVDFSVKAQM